MKTLYQEALISAIEKENHTEKLTYLTSLLRSLLQTVSVSIFEITKDQTPSDEVSLFDLTNRFTKPSDGLPVEAIETLTPLIRGYAYKDFLPGWFEKTKDVEYPISKRLIEWVQFRNKKQGHGVIDSETSELWSSKTESIIRDCLTVFSDVIPKIHDNGELYLPKSLNRLSIKTPLIYENQPIVINQVSARKGIWRISGQTLSWTKSNDFTTTLPEENIFNNQSIKEHGGYELSEIVSNNKDYSFFHNIPVRQTDTFEGRKDEISKLVEWFDDEDSRYCLVYGDGGYGKTTLVLEMLNQFLESQYDFNEPLPTVISYHTAKITRWTEEGLKHFTSITPAVDECIRELMRCFDPVLSKDWYSISGRQLIDKSIGVLRENKLNRNDILLVIDNTETLATSQQEVKDLGAFFKTVGKSIGRIIITSRRREFIEATPILIEGLTEAEGVSLMQRLANDYGAVPIQQAGEATLRKVSKKLMNKPILLEALVKYISRSNLGIDSAIENVFKKSNEDLLDFLYDDAWARMNQFQKEVFLVLVNLSSPLDQSTISRACQEIGIQHTEFQSALEETHFSVLTDYGRSYFIELVDLAGRFFLQQFSKLDDLCKNRLRNIAHSVDLYATERERIEREYRTDRVAEAFRSEYAKAAKVHADKGEIDEAIEMYELAVEDDPVNSSLHDRFSWLLLNRKRDFNYAKEISKKAIELDDNNCDAIVGLALVHYRLGELNEGDTLIEMAKSKGRPLSFCLLRKAIARFYKSREETNINKKLEILEEAFDLLEKAEKSNSRSNGYDEKNHRDIIKYKDLTRRQITNWRTKKTKSQKIIDNL
ncbi:tetratricopeptide repeat protein [Marinobacterium stanieri]|uniref:Novel STAND NTPase 1 domain-containing protein n=1 Tax=Marinobacterium stanieri TaxID=49186 RepID=A0A1N6NQH4_9GAMM|nr:hypothetical protein [Marinobacterium stanieri]SIP94257.1 hypothetical protein SAMN05421647_101485 [Marinobacterium stanieri]